MKRPMKIAITITIALILVSSLTYAAEKKKEARELPSAQELTPEDEAVKAELLAAVEDHQDKLRVDRVKAQKAENRGAATTPET